MLRAMLIGRCSTVYKIDCNDVMEKPDGLPNRKLLNYKDCKSSIATLHYSCFPRAGTPKRSQALHCPSPGRNLSDCPRQASRKSTSRQPASNVGCRSIGRSVTLRTESANDIRWDRHSPIGLTPPLRDIEVITTQKISRASSACWKPAHSFLRSVFLRR
jgi:hypothetical protein